MNWTVIFAVLTVLGPILIATSAKKQAGDKDQPMGVQAGYLALVLGGISLAETSGRKAAARARARP